MTNSITYIYLSHANYIEEDVQVKEALQTAFKPLQKTRGVEILKKNAPLPGETELLLDTDMLSKVSIFILLLSHDFLAKMEAEIKEIEKLVKENNQKRIFLCMARKCHFESQDFSFNFEWLHQNNQVISVNRNINDQLIAEIKEKFVSEIDEQSFQANFFTIDFEGLTKKLHIFLDEQNLNSTLRLLQKIISSSFRLKRLRKIEKTYDELFRVFSHKSMVNEEAKNKQNLEAKIGVWKEGLGQIKLETLRFIKELQPQDLIKDWQLTYILESSGQQENREKVSYFYLFTPADKIQLPEHEKKLTNDQKQEYKRLFYACQDALAVDDFEFAYDFALKLKNAIEPESAQLYEYLLLSYFRKEGSDKIIEEALKENGGTCLKHLVLFAGRYKALEEMGFCPSPTGKINITQIANNLSETLRKHYSQIAYDYILSDNEDDIAQRGAIERCIETAMIIYKYMNESMRFFEIGINELAGGGKYDWIHVGLDTEGEWQLEDRTGFGAVNHLKEIKIILEERAEEMEAEEAHYKVLADDLLSNLEFKYRTIRKANNEKKIGKRAIRKAILKCIDAFKIGFLNFNDRRFLKIPIQELKGFGMLKWFDFDSDGLLIENEHCEAISYSALGDLKIMIERQEEVSWEKIEKEVIEITYENYLEKTARLHRNLSQIIKGKRSTKQREQMIYCLERWQSAFYVYKHQTWIQKSIEELVGNGLFLWFDFKAGQLITRKTVTNFHFNALEHLEKLLPLTKHYPKQEADYYIAKNIFEKEIKLQYGFVSYRNKSCRPLIKRLLQKAIQCYELFPEEDYLDFVYKELVEDEKLLWIGIRKGRLHNLDTFDAINNLDKIIELGEKKGEYSMEKAIVTLAKRRHRDAMDQYKKEINPYQRNNNFFDRTMVIQQIDQCESCFDLYPDSVFLEMPIKELSGNGRIRWRRRFPYFNWLRPKEECDNFDHKKKLEELLLKKPSMTSLIPVKIESA